MATDIFLCQKKILRNIKNVPSTYTCRNLFKEFNILSVTSVFIFELCVYVFLNRAKFKQNCVVHNFNTRQKLDFRPPKYNLNLTKMSPNVLGVRLFNALPMNIKDSNNLLSFKKELKQLLIDKCVYSLVEFCT